MALLIEKNTTVLGNINISELYVRLGLNYNIEGKKIEIFSQVYPSRESYDDGIKNNFIKIDGIPFNSIFDYDRTIDGSDLVTVAHNKFKERLSTDTYKTINVTDPSTGKIVYIQEPILDESGEQLTDPSTGELLWQNGDPSTMEVLNIPKFAEDSSISIIDID